jgi:hypothetical protein
MMGCRTWASTALKVLCVGFEAQYCPMAGAKADQRTVDHSPKIFSSFFKVPKVIEMKKITNFCELSPLFLRL